MSRRQRQLPNLHLHEWQNKQINSNSKIETETKKTLCMSLRTYRPRPKRNRIHLFDLTNVKKYEMRMRLYVQVFNESPLEEMSLG